MSKLHHIHQRARQGVGGSEYQRHSSSRHGESPALAWAGRRLASFCLAAVALFAAAFLSALPASASGIFVRAATGTQPNEADLVTEGANHTLQYYWATPGSVWHHAQVAGPGTTFSAPSIFVRAATGTQPNEADIVAQGPSHTLQYYFATPGS